MVIVLPYPPSVNDYWLRNKNGSVRVSSKGVQFRNDVGWLTSKGRKKLTGEICVQILMFPPDKRRRDVDNILKATLDALQHAGFYDDDSQISRLVVERSEAVVKGGKLEVAIYPFFRGGLRVTAT